MTECTCKPCTAYHDWPEDDPCCFGTLIASFDRGCPIPAHAELAVKQHGPRTPREETT